ncbi:colanic acid/amylovoran biosynthesis glycosyltransferase [Luteibacter sp. UNCMF331Sha3.1]|uniref:glycosyltransferase n=1 Tax=Luteibacter sp. UNCMF331Sha3.1 TaxID=1502760 RepID=UPI0008AD03BD|nr:glycosyltransferase [Luteibacter sp. UNCMF331Sha3.1]SEN21170.1 colanic acid/amylovoran biosynthesis glycosyltransferase [Luteibacter sp. UNCMF331Sha3.1]
MTVLFVLPEFPRYSETFVIDQIVGLLDRGFDVRILAVSRGQDPKTGDIVSTRGLMDRATFVFPQAASGARKWTLLLRRLRDVLPGLPDARVRRALSVRRYGHAAKSLVLAGAARRLAQPLRADAIIAHFGPMGVLAANLRSLGLLEGPLFTVFHGYDLSQHGVLARHADDYRRLFDSGERMLPISERWALKLAMLGCDTDKIQVHRMGVDLDSFPFRAPVAGIPDASRTLRVVSVARLVEKKGVTYLCEAMALLAARGVPATLEVIGDGPLQASLRRFVDDRALGDRVFLSGRRDKAYVQSALAAADVFALPSVTAIDGDQEGIPVSLMEAMASGVPCLSTVHSGIPELIEDGRSGWLVPERDAPALADRLEAIQRGDYDIAALARRARYTVEAHFDQRRLHDELATRLAMETPA